MWHTGWKESSGGRKQRMQKAQNEKPNRRRRESLRCEAELRMWRRSLSPVDDPAPLCLHWEKGNGRRIYCWVLTCTHSWCCFSPLSPSAIPKASKTTGCQVVTAGFRQLLQQPWNQVPSLAAELCVLLVSVCRGWLSVCLGCTCGSIAACVSITLR